MGKKRITKKELKEDSFILFARRVNGFIRQNKGRVISWAVIAGLLLTLIFIITTTLRRWETTSLEELRQAQEVYRKASDEEGFKEARDKFSQILKRHTLVSPRKMALFYKGSCEYRLGEYNEASLSFKRFIERYPRHYLSPFAREALANICEQKGDYPGAISAYEALIKDAPEGFNASYAWLSLGRCHKRLKNYKEAREAYQKVVEGFSKSSWLEEARLQLETIKELQERNTQDHYEDNHR